jgi:F0F1-type ATP synthase membrane subunit c/vacuolar-type H+-ATPase subunit K
LGFTASANSSGDLGALEEGIAVAKGQKGTSRRKSMQFHMLVFVFSEIFVMLKGKNTN